MERIWQRKTSLAVQWLRIHASSAKDVGSNPGQGTKISHVSWSEKKEKMI